jgi:signal transduction histidine kinase
MTTAAGGAFLEWLVGYLPRVVGADIALVGEFAGLDATLLDVKAITRRHASAPPLRCDLRGSPFHGIAATGDVFLREGAARTFPSDTLLAPTPIEAAAGILLRDTHGQPLGVLAVMHGGPFPEPDAVMPTLRLFGTRLAGEIELLRAASHSRLLTEPPTDDADAAFAALLAGVAGLLGVKVAFAAELVDRDLAVSRTVALAIDGRISDNVQYEMRGTPCEYVLTARDAFYPSDVRARFPRDEFLAEIGAEGYYSFAFFGPDGGPMGHLGLVHDRPLPLSVRDAPLLRALAIRAREALQARAAARGHERLERALLSVQERRLEERFVPGVAHDLRTLLTALKGSAELLLLQCPPDERARTHLERTRKLCMRAHELVGHLLALVGRGRISVVALDLNGIVTETVALLRPSLPPGVEIALDLDGALPRVAGCPAEIAQVAMNLVLNAVEACGAAGRVRVATSVARLERGYIEQAAVGRDGAEGRFARLSVEDSGHGILEEDRSRLFDPHFTTKGEGHGLGLAAVAKVARRHGGVIHVTSAVDRGSAFHVSFPLG